MADFLISTEQLRHAATHLRRTADLVEPRSAELTVSPAALGSDDVYDALNPITIQQTARARKLAAELTSLCTVLMGGAFTVELQDQSLADRIGD